MRLINQQFFLWVVIFYQGLCSALPYVLLTNTLQAWYMDKGYALVAVGWLSLLSQPYILKFLWADICDNYAIIRNTHRKSWIICTQIMLIGLLLIISALNPKESPILLGIIAFIAAIVSSTQDLNIDAYRIGLIDINKDMKKVNTVYIIGFRLGYLLAGVGAIFIAIYTNWQLAYLIMAVLMIIGLIITSLSQEHYSDYHQNKITKSKAIKQLFINNGWLFFILIFLFEFGNSMITNLFPNYLYTERALSLSIIALIIKTSYLLALTISPFVALSLTKKYSLAQVLQYCIVVESFIFLLVPYWSQTLSSTFLFHGFLGLCEGISSILIISLYTQGAAGKTLAFNYAFIAAVGGAKIILTPVIAVWIIHYLNWNILFMVAGLAGLPGYVLVARLTDFINRPNLSVLQNLHSLPVDEPVT